MLARGCQTADPDLIELADLAPGLQACVLESIALMAKVLRQFMQLVIGFIRRKVQGCFAKDHGFRSPSPAGSCRPNGHFGTAATSGTHVLGKLLQRRLDGFAGKVRTGLGNDQVFAVVEHHGALRRLDADGGGVTEAKGPAADRQNDDEAGHPHQTKTQSPFGDECHQCQRKSTTALDEPAWRFRTESSGMGWCRFNVVFILRRPRAC